jgi:TonB family protein
MRLGEQGIITLVFRIDVDGSTKDIRIRESSGYVHLNDAAISCASHWTYAPARANAQPIPAVWLAKVYFLLSRTPEPPKSVPSGHPQLCSGEPEIKDATVKPTTLLLKVSSHGEVNSASILHSSGSETLDEFALKCANDPNTRQYLASNDDSTLLLPFFWTPQENR